MFDLVVVVVAVALVNWMEEKISRSRGSFYRKNGALSVLCGGVPKFPKGSRGSAPTVNMTNTFVNEKKKKKEKSKRDDQNSKSDAIPFSEFQIFEPAHIHSWLDPDPKCRFRCFGPDRLDSART